MGENNEQYQDYQKRDDLFLRFTSKEFNQDNIRELLMTSGMFKAMFEMIYRDNITPYQALAFLAKENVEMNKKIIAFIELMPNQIKF